MLLALALGPVALGVGSFSDTDIEFSEAKMTLQSVTAENEVLRQQLAEAKDSIQSLTDSLAVANSEAELFRKEVAELKLRMEALGVEGLSADKSKLEQRLLKAVRDLQIVQADKDKLADQLVQLSEAVLRFAQSANSTDAEARLTLDAQMRSVADALGIPGNETGETSISSGSVSSAGSAATTVSAPTGDLTNGMVVSIKEELSLVVLNLGTRHGVKVGMPFRVMRRPEPSRNDSSDSKSDSNGKPGAQPSKPEEVLVGIVRVVDVREKISGAVIQSLDSEKNKIKVGDRLKVDAR